MPDLSTYLPPPHIAWAAGGVCALILTVMLGRAALRAVRACWQRAENRPAEDILTIVAACIATAVSAQGMWRFAGHVLELDGLLRVMLFAFIEVAVLTSAVRARRSMRENYSAGIDGIAVWVLACLTAVFSALDAGSLAEAVFRLAAPLVAAWLWERGMAIERHRITGRARIKWRFTPERVMVRLGLAEASDRTASEVDAQRRLTRVALAADKVAELAETKPGRRRHRRAVAALKKRGRQMVTHTAVSSDQGQQHLLMDQLAVTRSITRLAEAAPVPFWEAPADDAVNTAATVDEPRTDPCEDTPMVTAPVTLEALPVSDEVNIGTSIECTPEPSGTGPAPVTEVFTGEAGGDDPDSGRDRPDDQDNREAEKWIRAAMRKGRTPTYDEVKDRYGFSRGWARLRVLAARDEMTARGYRFLPRNVVQPPADTVTVNGTRSEHAGDVAMTTVGGGA